MILHYQLRPLPWLPTLGQCMGIVNFAAVLWLLSFLPNVSLNLLLEAALYVLVAWTVVAYLTLTTSSIKRSGMALLQTSLTGIWLGPGFTLSLARSPLFILLGFFFLMATAYLLMEDLISERWTTGRVSNQPTLAWSITAAWSLQASWAFFIAGRPRVSLVLAVAATGIVAAGMVVFGANVTKSPKPRSAAQTAISIVVAIALAAVGMLNTTGHATRPFAFTRAVLERLGEDTPSSQPENYSGSKLYQPSNVVLGSGGVPGVVLRPKHKEDQPITIPKPTTRTLAPSHKDPIRIPFTGDYELFQAPLLAPPRNAPVLRGDPFSLSFHTRDVSLFMEASQRLVQTVDLSCCSRVDLEIRNQSPTADEYVELILIDTLAGTSQSLGMAKTVLPKDTLEFRIPTWTRIHQLDSFRVKIHRGLFQRRSSRIVIDGTVLIPRL